MRYLCLPLIFFVAQITYGQDTGSITSQPTLNDFLGIWEAFQEGSTPDKSKREEPSKLVIFRDSAKRIVVFLATRYADRQIRFRYGIATLKNDRLLFTDQNGFQYYASFGRSADFGRFLGVSPDYPGAEGDLGSYHKVNIK